MEQLEEIILNICDMPFKELIAMIATIFCISVATFSLIFFALWGLTQSVKLFKKIIR